MINETERDKSEFNNAVAYLNRVNFLHYKCGYHSSMLDSHGWFLSLMALYRELSTEMDDKERNDLEERFVKLTAEVLSQQRTSTINAETFWKLHNIEIKLRQVVKEAGLQQQMKDLAMSALK